MKIKIDRATKSRLKRLGMMAVLDAIDGEIDEPELLLDLMHVLTNTLEEEFERKRNEKSTSVLNSD